MIFCFSGQFDINEYNIILFIRKNIEQSEFIFYFILNYYNNVII